MARFARAARAGDGIRGRCNIPIHTKHHHCPHRNSGRCNGESPNVFINGLSAQREGDGVTFAGCQHGGYGKSIDGSASVFVNGRAAVRIKDAVNCTNCAQIMYVIEGSNNVFIGD